MKKGITIAIFILLALGLGYYLFKISPQDQSSSLTSVDSLFSLKPTADLKEPSAVRADDHILGDPQAKNTLVAFEDLECPACKAFEPVLKQAPDKMPSTKVIFRHFPLIGLHKNATIAALASEAAAAQGKFWEFSFSLYDNQESWAELADPTDKFVELAKAAGVANSDQFKTDIQARKYVDRVQRDLTEGENLKVQGTPSVYFNGHFLQNGTIDDLQKEALPYYNQ